ncbi:MAG: AMP-binding protein [Pseudomonadota bacterium]
MLTHQTSYELLINSFRWNLPENLNMGWDVCDKWADDDPQRIAIIDLTSGKRCDISFGELKALSDKLANYLVSLGIKPGDRVGVLRSQSAWTAAAHIAAWKVGAVSIPLFKLFGEEALLTRLADASAMVVVTDLDGLEKLKQINGLPNSLKHLIVPEALDFSAQPDTFFIADTNPHTPAVLIYTSGTTGSPKGALHGHRVLMGHLPGVEISHDFLPQPNDVLWTPADWAWIGGLFDVLMPGLHQGVPVVAARMKKFNAEECQRIIEMACVRNIFFPPTALRMLKAEGFKVSGLRSVACGGEPLGEEMLNWGRQALGVTINEFYGQTECNMVVSSCSSLFDAKPGCMGKPVPGHEITVIDETGMPCDGEGDIAIKRGTPVMMLEYWNNPQATQEKFRGNWLLTGDRGIRDGDYIRFIGRDDDVITSAGYRIGPAEIEDCLLKHSAVASVGVVGKPDLERTQIVKAYILLRDGIEPSDKLSAELQRHVKTRLAAYEYPREIAFVDNLPMTVTGKIIRKELKTRAAAEAAQK